MSAPLSKAFDECTATHLDSFLKQYKPHTAVTIQPEGNYEATFNPRTGYTKCRGIDVLYQMTGIFTGHVFLTPPEEFEANAVSYLVLFPCSTDEAVLELFRKTSYYSNLEGEGLVTPIISPLNVPQFSPSSSSSPPSNIPVASFPVFVVAFRPLIPGSYSLRVAPRFVSDDLFDPPLSFVGESEKRACPQPKQWCMDRTNGGGEKNCMLMVVLWNVKVTVRPSPRGDVGAADFLALPLAQNGEASPDGFWVKLGNSREDCERGERRKMFEGDACSVGDPRKPNLPIFAYQPSDKRYRYYQPKEIVKCFEERGIGEVRVQGDSLARGAYLSMAMAMSSDFGLAQDYAEILKKAMRDSDKSGDVLGGMGMPAGMGVSYVEEWGETVDVMERSMWDAAEGSNRAGVFAEDGPNLYIYNHGAPAHKKPLLTDLAERWTDRVSDPSAIPPKVNIFLLPITLQGQRNPKYSRMEFRYHGETLEIAMKKAGFAVVNQEQLTMGWPVESTGQADGFHYGQNAMAMTSQIIVNMVCNAPKETLLKENLHKW